MHQTKNDIPADRRQKLVQLLNARLADALDLYSHAKQAHWNVKGPSFIALHKLFDEVATAVEEHIDLIAERAVLLGGVAVGTVRAAAQASTLKDYPRELALDLQHVDALSTSLATFGAAVRAAIDQSDEIGDKDTADLFTGVSREIDKFLWFVEAHIQVKR